MFKYVVYYLSLELPDNIEPLFEMDFHYSIISLAVLLMLLVILFLFI